MKKRPMFIITAIVVLCMIIASAFFSMGNSEKNETKSKVKVGFVYVGDNATPYTNNFIRAEHELTSEYGDEVEIDTMANVSEADGKTAIQKLVDDGCDIIFTTSYGYGEAAKEIASENPDVQICQATCSNANEDPVLSNYHTFMGEIYEGRYVSGVIAGEKMKELIDDGTLSEKDVVIGYVGAFPYAEVISGYTAFFLGVRSVVPEATMKVKYTNTWSDYAIEKRMAAELIDEGCVLISQHSDTIGPAVACEEARAEGKTVYHVGYNQSMTSVAPTTSLVSSRINWNPYITGAVKAVMNNERIEDVVKGNVNGNDIGAGFDRDWVQIVEINEALVSKETEEKVNTIIDEFKSGDVAVFKGDYTGVDPFDDTDTIDLSKGYIENEKASAPSFHYVLKDVIEVED